MKKILTLFLIMAVCMFGVFAGDFSGDTRIEAGYDTELEEYIYSVDAGGVYTVGVFAVGLDVYTETFEDCDIGLPVTMVLTDFTFKIEPGVNNVFEEDAEVYTIDSELKYVSGPLALSVSGGYGTDEIFNLGAAMVLTDFIPNTVFDLKLYDCDNYDAGETGIVEIGATIKY